MGRSVREVDSGGRSLRQLSDLGHGHCPVFRRALGLDGLMAVARPPLLSHRLGGFRFDSVAGNPEGKKGPQLPARVVVDQKLTSSFTSLDKC